MIIQNSVRKKSIQAVFGLVHFVWLGPSYHQLWYKNEYFNIFPGGNLHQRNILKVMQVIMIILVDGIPSFSQYILHINGVCENFATAFKVLLIISIRCMLNNLHLNYVKLSLTIYCIQVQTREYLVFHHQSFFLQWRTNKCWKKNVEAFCYPPRFCAFSSDKISNFSRSPISINGNINPNKQATNDNKWQMGCSEKINYCAKNVIGALHAMRFGWKIYI